MDTTAAARSATFPAGSFRSLVAQLGDNWALGAARPRGLLQGEQRESCAMLTAERVRLAAVKPFRRVEWREFSERNARGERHPVGDDGYPGAVL